MTPEEPPGEPSRQVNSNEKGTVGVQAGYVIGNVTTYQMTSSDPVEQLLKATNCVAGVLMAEARGHFRDLYSGGHATAEAGYFWSLAILRDKSLDHLDESDWNELRICRKLVSSGPWSDALCVVLHLLESLTEATPAEDFDGALKRIDDLPRSRQGEIHRHLSNMISHALNEGADAVYREEVQRQRLSGDRERRAPMYFEPIPAAPSMPELRPPKTGGHSRGTAVFGGVLGLGGLALCCALSVIALPAVTVGVVGLMAAGAWLVATHGLTRAYLDELIAEHDHLYNGTEPSGRYSLPIQRFRRDPIFEDGLSDDQDRLNREERHRRERFDYGIDHIVGMAFDKHAPKSKLGRSQWLQASSGYQKRLKDDLRDRYVDMGAEADALLWLARAHARRVWEARENGTLHSPRRELRIAADAKRPLRDGLVLVALGAALSVVATLTVTPQASFAAALLYLVSGHLLHTSHVEVPLMRRRLFEHRRLAAEERHAWEEAAFAEHERYLDDRPDDTEIAQWLDGDKEFIRFLAMDACDLTNSDVIAHAVLAEPNPPYVSTRVAFGPQRFTRYRVLVFLLTRASVRLISTELNFKTGVAGNQRRTTFRYDAITSAGVVEKGLIFDRERRRKVRRRPGKSDSEITFSRVFQFSLVNRDSVKVQVADVADGLVLDSENADNIAALALESSGIGTALRILETVTAEGRTPGAATRTPS